MLYKSTELTDYTPTICNIAYEGTGRYSIQSHPEIHTKWKSMIKRCYSTKYSRYKNITVCVEWLNFQNFAQWYEENWKPWMDSSWHLDKDILVKGNKVYSPETCAFVPKEINNLILNRKMDRGDYPIGVRLLNGSFHSRISIKNKYTHLGVFHTPEEAFRAYKNAKEVYIKEVANKWIGKVAEKVYNALHNYQVEITD